MRNVMSLGTQTLVWQSLTFDLTPDIGRVTAEAHQQHWL